MRDTPAVGLRSGFEGFRSGQTFQQNRSPDIDLAVGPSQLIETVNTAATLRSKNGVQIASINLNVMFPPQTLLAEIFSPVCVYDELAQRFYVAVLEQDPVALTSFLRVAVSNTSTISNFTTDFTERQIFDLVQLDTTVPLNGLMWGDYPRIGYNYDGIFVTVNMIGFGTNQFDHTRIVSMGKTTMLDQNNATLRFGIFDRFDLDFSMVPTRMHGAKPDGPMYFVSTYGVRSTGPNSPGALSQDFSDTALRVTRMTNFLTPNPGFQVSTVVVPDFDNGVIPDTIQPGSGTITFPQLTLTPNDTRMLSASWRDNRLVCAHNANLGAEPGVDGEASVRWYELSTANPIATLVQVGTIDPGPSIFAYHPAIEIALNGDIGLTYMQNSEIEFPAMYITGRTDKDPKGLMQAPVRARRGELPIVNGNRTGQYAGMALDPLIPNLFWAAHQYGSANVPAPNNNWATYIVSFTVSPMLPSLLKVFGPLRWTYNRGADTLTGNVTILNPLPTITGTMTLTLRVPDASFQILAPAGVTRVGNTFTIRVNGPFVQNSPLRIPIVIRDPLRRAISTFQLGVAVALT